MVNSFVQNASIQQVLSHLDAGYRPEEGEVLQTTSNTDRKVVLYSTIDGEPRPVLRIDAERVLRKVIPGTTIPAFWAEGMPGEDPRAKYVTGQIKCMLHPEFDESDGVAGFDRAWLDSIGLAGRTCNMMAPDKPSRADFKTAFARDAHMQKKHRDEWAIIQSALQRQREREEAEERRRDREAMMALASGGGRRRRRNDADDEE